MFQFKIASTLNLNTNQVAAALELFEAGSTIPFIARYRKEKTGVLDEVQLENIFKLNKELIELEKRRTFIIENISSQKKMTAELEKQINAAIDLQELEDIYLPFKQKRKTRAAKAIEQGLEPLANIILQQKVSVNNELIQKYINKQKELNTIEDALNGALDIIAERINENAIVRSSLRKLFFEKSIITAKVNKTKQEDAIKFKDYFSVEEALYKMRPHRFLAILRGHNEGFLKLNISPNEEISLGTINRNIIHAATNSHLIKQATEDAYKRLLKPSLENETIQFFKLKADIESIDVFASNAKQLLLAAPMGNKNVMAIDPGFRTGCKVVCLDGNGKILNNETLFPLNGKDEAIKAKAKIYNKLQVFKIEAIAIGNGTGGRETEQFIRNMKLPKEIVLVMVNESGASIYSASSVAREEFPEYDITVRSAISIGRRLIDPLAELVKIDPKSIGVGQYQHDVDAHLLNEKLSFTVSNCVNNVGVNLNTASKELLAYVSGIGPTLAKNIVDFRNQNGKFSSREKLIDVPRMGFSSFTQCAGFLRIPDAINILDNTGVHPERYAVIKKMAKDTGFDLESFISNKKFLQVDLNNYVNDEFGLPTLTDIIEELKKPGRDPRKQFKVVQFNENITKPEHLIKEMVMNGVVTNITAFGCFVDIGVHQDGLVHISQITDGFIDDPAKIVSVGQAVRVKVVEVELERKRIQLTMKGF
jgi:uncharacterized protein